MRIRRQQIPRARVPYLGRKPHHAATERCVAFTMLLMLREHCVTPLPPDTLLKPSDVTLSLEPPIGRGGGGNFAFVFLLPLLAHSLPTSLALRTCTPHLGTHALFPACDLCICLGQIFQGIYGDIRVALKENLNFRKRVNETMEIVGCGG